MLGKGGGVFREKWSSCKKKEKSGLCRAEFRGSLYGVPKNVRKRNFVAISKLRLEHISEGNLTEGEKR